METPELKPRSIADESPYYKSFKEAKRNVNERSKTESLETETRFTLYRLQGRTSEGRQWRKYRQR